MTSPRLRVAAAAALVVAAMATSQLARADVWARLDADGRPHFATKQLDLRYQLFFKGASSFDPAPADDSAAASKAALLRSPLYRRVVGHPNARRYAALLEQGAAAAGLDAALVKAVVAVESAYDPQAVSDKGAVGLMQVMPDTGVRYGVAPDARRTVAQKLADPALNVRIGARYLRDLLDRFDDDLTLALAAYNAGEQAVHRYGDRVPPYPETQDYVVLVREFEALYRPAPAVKAPAVTPARPVLDLPGRRAPAGSL